MSAWPCMPLYVYVHTHALPWPASCSKVEQGASAGPPWHVCVLTCLCVYVLTCLCVYVLVWFVIYGVRYGLGLTAWEFVHHCLSVNLRCVVDQLPIEHMLPETQTPTWLLTLHMYCICMLHACSMHAPRVLTTAVCPWLGNSGHLSTLQMA